MHLPYRHYPARIEKDFDGRWLEGEAREPAEEVVGAVRCPSAGIATGVSLGLPVGMGA